MPLLSLHAADPTSVAQFTIDQVVAVAGDGTLKDGSTSSLEFRDYLQKVSTKKLGDYVEQCLTTVLQKGGFILQDLVNEIGRRLSYQVKNGRYQGVQNDIGFDGLWIAPEGNTLIAEVKTTDAYRLSLDTLATYRRKLSVSGQLSDSSSILIITGRSDTGELEAQIRGSRHAWDIRLISADALVKLAMLKEGSEAAETGLKIRSLLTPLEYTRLDRLVDVVFTTVQDVDTNDEPQVTPEIDLGSGEGGQLPSSVFPELELSGDAIRQKREQIIRSINRQRGVNLTKVTRALYSDAAAEIRIASGMSKRYTSQTVKYWYAFHPSWQNFLNASNQSYFVLGCLDKQFTYLIPFEVLNALLPRLNTTQKGDKLYWHIHLVERDGEVWLVIPKADNVSIEQYAIPLTA